MWWAVAQSHGLWCWLCPVSSWFKGIFLCTRSLWLRILSSLLKTLPQCGQLYFSWLMPWTQEMWRRRFLAEANLELHIPQTYLNSPLRSWVCWKNPKLWTWKWADTMEEVRQSNFWKGSSIFYLKGASILSQLAHTFTMMSSCKWQILNIRNWSLSV